ncbi:MAG: bifunctional riboflavin kinase/FAD synthetase [Woeseiaceae bacterium]|nr:bifunctional riboflavin kinase/FAD synthetase [Woeseiaceae bacterium]
MLLVRHLDDLPFDRLERGSAVTIGSYDGIHLGHRHLLSRIQAIAEERDMATVVMSFEPTPKEFFHSANPVARLMRFREKFEALEALGIDVFYCPRFSPAMRSIPAGDFIRRILVHGLNARGVVIGDDFRFARRREGGLEELEIAGRALDFDVEQVPSIAVGGERVSSTAIREALEAGDLGRATALLGRPYRMSGRIVRGEQVGRKLGYPTANVDLRRRQSAVMGIFAVRVHGVGDTPIDGVASVGSRPTFNGTKPLLEVHLFDFDEDIYGRYIHVDFVAHLRDQKKYAKVDELVAQMHLDADNARSILAANAA